MKTNNNFDIRNVNVRNNCSTEVPTFNSTNPQNYVTQKACGKEYTGKVSTNVKPTVQNTSMDITSSVEKDKEDMKNEIRNKVLSFFETL